MGKIVLAVAVLIGLGASAHAQQGGQPSPPLMAWSLAKFVHEANGKLSGAWIGSSAACAVRQVPITEIDTALLVRLTVAGTCNGEPEYLMIRRAQPIVVADGACAFDYVTVGGMIPGVFQEITEKTAPAGAMATFRQALPNMRRVFATKQAGGFIALLGWSARPLAGSSAASEKTLLDEAGHAQSAGQLDYKVLADTPWALVNFRNYDDKGKQARDVGMDVVTGRNCLFSIKFAGHRHPGDDGVWASIDTEFQRIRRVIANHEAGKPWAVSGAE